ncbi:MAG: hypothetical protein A3I08_00025 [Candidatus Andersenbacteria bacterium RIFCSPLOWO2_02_FULL_46_11]|nr:MAG: hypothetical protein A3I08_00025 [Candidatus Andersenbacteria bacterium RIFCSPLOWO2_02_FULL_46_11]
MKKAWFKLILWVVTLGAVSGLAVRSGWGPLMAKGETGDLVIDWAGELTGDPIFEVSDMMPGQIETRMVMVTNNDTVTRTVGVRVAQTATVGGLADVLAVVVKVNGASVYGEGSGTGFKTLAQFFGESAVPGVLDLAEMSAGETVEITFAVTFMPEIGNYFNNNSVTFDITLGLAGAETEIPVECGGTGFNLTGEILVGSAGSDLLRGTAGNDLIFGLEGSDSIRGLGGDDCLLGGTGSDSLRGGEGNDVLLGGEGSDTLRGNEGNDALFGGAGKDSLRGDLGNDSLNGEGEDDSLKGGQGDDVLTGGAGVDVAKGEQGADTCDAEVEKTCEL